MLFELTVMVSMEQETDLHVKTLIFFLLFPGQGFVLLVVG